MSFPSSLVDFNQQKESPPYLTSPRSLEACRIHGIDPSELIQRPLNFFQQQWKDEPDATVQLRCERYEISRRKLLRTARQERERIMASDARRAKWQNDSMSPVKDFGRDSEEAAMIKRERQRLEKMQRRQQHELQQMLAHEMQKAQMQQGNLERVNLEKRREAERKRHARKQQREYEERKKQMAAAVKLNEEEEEKRLRQQMAQQHHEAKVQAKREERKKRLKLQQAARHAKERSAKAEQIRLETQAIFEQQQQQILAKEKERADRDKLRQRRVEESRAQLLASRADKRAKADKRVSGAREAQQSRLEQQRIRIEHHQKEVQQRHNQFLEQRERERAKKRADSDRETRERAKHLQRLEMEEEDRKEAIVAHGEALERRMQERAENIRRERESRRSQKGHGNLKRANVYEEMKKRDDERVARTLVDLARKEVDTHQKKARQEAARARHRMEQQLRQEELNLALERQKRADEYKREKLLKKIERENFRTAQMAAQKDELKKKRQDAATNIKRQREKIMKEFDQMKDNHEVAGNLETFELGGGNFPSSAASKPKRPSTATNKKHGHATGSPKGGKRLRASSAPPTRPPHVSAANATGTAERKVYESKTAQPTLSAKAAPAGAKSTSRPRSAKPRKSRGTSAKKRSPKQLRGASKSAESSTDAHRARAELDSLRRRQNEHLLEVLEEEQRAEEQREAMMRQVRDDGERAKIESIFGAERAKASERIMKITEEHESVLCSREQEMQELGLV